MNEEKSVVECEDCDGTGQILIECSLCHGTGWIGGRTGGELCCGGFDTEDCKTCCGTGVIDEV